jgi:tRNA(Ile)-lysidine synthetase-like protein
VLLAVDGETVAVERRSRPEAWRRPVVDGEEILLPRLAGTLSYREGPRPPEPSAFQGLSAAFDRESVRGSLSLFSPPAGAYRPLGFRGSRKVSDQLSSAKLPMWLRRVVPVLADAEGPVWVLGSRIADRVRVRDSTCRTGYVRVRPGGSDGIMSGLSGPDAVTEQDADA